MKDLKLTIDLLPKGAWNNDFSKTLPKKDWDAIRNNCYKKANGKCEICGFHTEDLDAHEVWDFNIEKRTQTLKDIIAICSKCHGVIHFKNSVRLGYGEQAKEHFMKTNNCSETDFASHLMRALYGYEEKNKIFRWKMIANLEKFGGKDIEIKQRNIPLIKSPYTGVEWEHLSFQDTKGLFKIKTNYNFIGAPKIISIEVDNYQGIICVKSLFADRIEWFLDEIKIGTKYHTAGLFTTKLKVNDLIGKLLKFKLIGEGGETISKTFELLSQEVL